MGEKITTTEGKSRNNAGYTGAQHLSLHDKIREMRSRLLQEGLLDYMDVMVRIGKEGPSIEIDVIACKLIDLDENKIIEMIDKATDIRSSLIIGEGWPVAGIM